MNTGNNFNIPLWSPEFIAAMQEAKQRDENKLRDRRAQWEQIASNVKSLGDRYAAEKEAERARKAQQEEAYKNRQFQGQQNYLNRLFQGHQNAENRKAQQEYNMTLKKLEEEKLKAKELADAKVKFAEIASKENPTVGDKVMMANLKRKYPEIDTYTNTDANGVEVKGSIWDDIEAQRNEASNQALAFAKFKAEMPTTFDKKNPKQATLDKIAASDFSSEQKKELYDAVSQIEDLSSKKKKAVQSAIAQNAADITKEQLTQNELERKVLEKISRGDFLNTDERRIALQMGFKFNAGKWEK